MGGDGMVHSSAADGTRTFSHSNHRGDVIGRSNSSRSLTSFALYEAYGTRPAGGVWGSDPDRQKANTKEEETDLQLLNEGMRYRDLETGTFLTRDPIGYADGPNVYCYVHCNPITHFDALGLGDTEVVYNPHFDWSLATPELAKESILTALAISGGEGGALEKGGALLSKIPGVTKAVEAARASKSLKVLGKGVDAVKSKASSLGTKIAEKSKAAAEKVKGFFGKGGSELESAAAKTTKEQLEAVAKEAHSSVGSGKGHVHGTKVHKDFEGKVNDLGRTDLHTEVSYKNGKRVKRGTKGSVRLDVVEGDVDAPTQVYDLKTGSAKLTKKRIQQIKSHVPTAKDVTEVR